VLLDIFRLDALRSGLASICSRSKKYSFGEISSASGSSIPNARLSLRNTEDGSSEQSR